MSLLNTLCQRFVRRLADDLFLADDLRAHARGWTVEPIHHGTGRRLRDPRWDRLSACHHCDAAGYRGIAACHACGGRGVLDAAAAPGVGNERPKPIRVTSERTDRP